MTMPIFSPWLHIFTLFWQMFPFPGPGLPPSGGTTFTLVGTPACNGGNNSASLTSFNASGANFLVLMVQELAAVSVGNVSTTPSNATPTSLITSGSGTTALLYIPSASTSGSMTITYTHSGNFPAMCVAAFSGANTTPADGTPTNNGGSGCGTGAVSCQAGAVSPGTNTGDLFISGIGDNETFSSFTIGTGYSMVQQSNTGASTSVGLGWKIQTGGAASENPTWTATVGGDNPNGFNIVLGAFKHQ